MAGPPFAPYTIVRLRGDFTITSDQVAVQEMAFGAIGAMVVNGEAFDAGIASIPTPWLESFDDRWYWHQYWSAQTEKVSTAQGEGLAVQFAHYPIDNRAMRKVEVGDVLVWVIENRSSAAAAAFMWNLRTLVKLH